MLEVTVEVAEAVAGPPRAGVVGGPEERVDDGLHVLQLDDDDEDDAGQLAVAVQHAHRHHAAQVGQQAERDAQDEVGPERRRRVRR